MTAPGFVGTQRRTGICILLTIVTIGFYQLYWYFRVHEQMKLHSGEGLGGLIALLLAVFVGPVMPFLSSYEVAGLYTRRSEQPPVSAITGLWIILPLVGAIVWFVKTNGALNRYWASLGAPAG